MKTAVFEYVWTDEPILRAQTEYRPQYDGRAPIRLHNRMPRPVAGRASPARLSPERRLTGAQAVQHAAQRRLRPTPP